MKPGDHDSESPTAYAIRSGLGWGRMQPADVLTWDRIVDLAVDAYWRNSAAKKPAA